MVRIAASSRNGMLAKRFLEQLRGAGGLAMDRDRHIDLGHGAVWIAASAVAHRLARPAG